MDFLCYLYKNKGLPLFDCVYKFDVKCEIELNSNLININELKLFAV